MRNKKVKGFTLIELIVVIAIIAVLAAILIPSLMGWVAKSSLRTANTNAKAVATNGAAVLSDLEVQGFYVTSATTFTGNTDNTVDSNEVKAQVEKLAGFSGDNEWGFEFDPVTEKVTYAYWRKNDSSPYMGTYPIEATARGAAKESGRETTSGGGGNSGGGGGDNSEG